MKILCGIDFSEPSRQACNLAAQLAKRFNDTLVLAHAVDVSAYGMVPDVASFAATFAESSRQALHLELNNWAASLNQGQVRTETCVLSGPADLALIKLAAEVQPRLIVAGTHGAPRVRHLLLGSVAARLTQTSPHPVLVVNHDNKNFGHRIHEDRPLRALIAVDDSEASLAAVQWIKQLRAVVPVDATFVHFYFPPDEHRRLGIVAPQRVDNDHAIMRALHRDLQARIGPLPGEGKTTLRIHANWVSVGERLYEECKAADADVLVLGGHQRSLLARLNEGSVVAQTLRLCDIPVLVVPARQSPTAERRSLPQMRVVLAATDLSELGNHAIPYAYALLKGGGGLVQLVHVCSRADEQDALTAQLRGLVPHEADIHGVSTEVHVIVDRPVAAAIAHAAERMGADAICMGSHGRDGLARAVMGSIPTEVGAHTRRPIFLVRGARP